MIRKLTLAFLLLYLFALMATQTIYGAAFFGVRWFALAGFAVLSALEWLSSPVRNVVTTMIQWRLSIYLVAWSLTVAMSDFQVFSLYRLLAHIMLLVPALLFLPSVFRLKQYTHLLRGLKLIVGIALLLCVAGLESSQGASPHGWYEGAFGNANALGHSAAIGIVLFTHSFINARPGPIKLSFAILIGLAVYLLLASFARSSFIAAFVGLGVLCYYYLPSLSRYVAGLFAVGIFSLMLFPGFSDAISGRILKHGGISATSSAFQQIIYSREVAFNAHIDGFLSRPWTGWGFGVDADTDLTGWQGEFSSVGFVGRDPVNDTLFTLESGGVVGFAAYLWILLLFRRAFPSRSAVNYHFHPKHRYSLDAELLNLQIAYLAAGLALVVLFQFDNTALAAGNLLAALLWIFLGAALAITGFRQRIANEIVYEPMHPSKNVSIRNESERCA